MSDICPKCALPQDLCMCETIAKEGQQITLKIVKRRFGKLMTVVEGLSKDVDVKGVAKKLKSKLACGGTAKNGVIELQGNHVAKVREELIKQGFSAESIAVEKPKFKFKGRR